MYLSKPRAEQGFTLIEIMMVVVIIGILVAIAYPNYQGYIVHSNRTEAFSMLNDAAARQERFFAQNNKYIKGENNTDDSIKNLGIPNVNLTADNKVESISGHYELELTYEADKSDGGYTLTATPQGSQARDEELNKCYQLALNAKGQQGAFRLDGSAAENCWR